MSGKCVRWGFGLLLLASGISSTGCGTKPPPNEVKIPPSEFFEWCAKEKFGVKSPEATSFRRSGDRIGQGEIGYTEYRAWIPSKTEEEARKELASAVAELRRVAAEMKVDVRDADDSADPTRGALPDPQPREKLLRYRIGKNQGELSANYELGETKQGDKTVKAYYLKLKLTEVVLQSG